MTFIFHFAVHILRVHWINGVDLKKKKSNYEVFATTFKHSKSFLNLKSISKIYLNLYWNRLNIFCGYK